MPDLNYVSPHNRKRETRGGRGRGRGGTGGIIKEIKTIIKRKPRNHVVKFSKGHPWAGCRQWLLV
jgi:hypothetical protein